MCHALVPDFTWTTCRSAPPLKSTKTRPRFLEITRLKINCAVLKSCIFHVLSFYKIENQLFYSPDIDFFFCDVEFSIRSKTNRVVLNSRVFVCFYMCAHLGGLRLLLLGLLWLFLGLAGRGRARLILLFLRGGERRGCGSRLSCLGRLASSLRFPSM